MQGPGESLYLVQGNQLCEFNYRHVKHTDNLPFSAFLF